jgi:DNA invertase Pin-like site-specific DNA recombinase
MDQRRLPEGSSSESPRCELQVRDLRAYCTARGFDLVREYVDVGQSGAKDSRPELNILMDDARKRQFDAIVVWRFDRFARSTKHLLSALEEFRSLGILFISYQENIDTSSALGQALFTIVSAVAQLERDLIRERVTAGIRNARANGKQPGALDAIEKSGQQPRDFLTRHVSGDWGEVPPEDIKENQFSLKHGFRLLSAYRTSAGERLWVITEANRSSTSILLPEEY